MVDSDMFTVTSSLVINSTERFRDQGVYTCTASVGVENNIGAVNILCAELVVQGKQIHIMLCVSLLYLSSSSSTSDSS